MSEQAHSGVRRLEHAATAGVVALAVGSFVLSYDALHQLAVTNHVPRPLAWIWPLIVDGFIVVASLAVLRARPAAYPWLLVLAFSTVSVVFNVLHAAPASVARLVAAIPPLTLVLSFELLMRQLRDRLAEPESDGNSAEAPATLTTHRRNLQEKTETDRVTAIPGARCCSGRSTSTSSTCVQASLSPGSSLPTSWASPTDTLDDSSAKSPHLNPPRQPQQSPADIMRDYSGQS